MDKNKLKPEKIALVAIIVLFVGILSYGLITKNPPVNPSPQISANQNGNPCPGIPTITDVDGNAYKTVLIGSQCWMKENLKVTKNPEGNAITRYCYDNDPKNCETDGGLYDWNTTMNSSTQEGAQGICPTDWHIPKDSEWYILESSLAVGLCLGDRTTSEGCDSAGTKLKTGGSSNFNGIFAGNRYAEGLFHYRGFGTYFWSSTENGSNAWHRDLGSSNSTVIRQPDDKTYGFSVRCLKN